MTGEERATLKLLVDQAQREKLGVGGCEVCGKPIGPRGDKVRQAWENAAAEGKPPVLVVAKGAI